MSKKLILAVVLTLSFAALSTVTPAPGRRYIAPATPDDPASLPFSGGVLVGKTFYLSGKLGLVDRKVPADPREEARNVLNAVRETLEQAGMTMDDLVSVQVFCSDVAHYGAFNEVYRTYFTKQFPARAFVGSGKLLFDARFEVQAIAVKR